MATHNHSILRINVQVAESLPYSGRVVDLGCGTAPYKEHILSCADEYVGVDWESSIHDTSQVDVYADLTKFPLPLDDECADTVCAFQVMEHLSEPSDFIAECFRILRPGGQVFLTTPFMWQVHEAPHDYFRYTEFGLRHLLSKNQFTDIKIEATTGYWLMAALKLNYQLKRLARGPLEYAIIPVWMLTQFCGGILDRISQDKSETASYVSTARKPNV